MRRRLPRPGVRLHRHSLPQLLIDGALVALAYVLAFNLRFDRGLTPSYAKLLVRTLELSFDIMLVVFLLFGV
jgi:hypothetical protein